MSYNVRYFARGRDLHATDVREQDAPYVRPLRSYDLYDAAAYFERFLVLIGVSLIVFDRCHITIDVAAVRTNRKRVPLDFRRLVVGRGSKTFFFFFFRKKRLVDNAFDWSSEGLSVRHATAV